MEMTGRELTGHGPRCCPVLVSSSPARLLHQHELVIPTEQALTDNRTSQELSSLAASRVRSLKYHLVFRVVSEWQPTEGGWGDFTAV